MLSELDSGLLAFMGSNLSRINNAFDERHILFSLVEDRLTHFRLLEEQLGGQLGIPFSVLHRSQLRNAQHMNPGSPAATINNVVSSRGSGAAKITQIIPVEIEYFLYVYFDNFDELNDLIEKWYLSAGTKHTVFSFKLPDVNEELFVGSLTLSDPSTVKPVRTEKEEDGLVYRQDFPITVTTYIVDAAKDAKIILNVTKDFILVDTDTSFDDAIHGHDAPH